MAICPRCGEENPDRARFCLACAAPLAEASPQQAERKVVSVIFVDLVGFTAGADAADPEDVHATLQPYHARVREEIERLGGVVEKYVGDAVMAVFGAPVAREDDAERAVRAGLRVLAVTEELGLQARAAVNTGEALVALDARAAPTERRRDRQSGRRRRHLSHDAPADRLRAARSGRRQGEVGARAAPARPGPAEPLRR